MTLKVSKGTKFRIMLDNNSVFSVERNFLWFIWWPVFKTPSAKGALLYIEMCGAEYNEQTDLWGVNK